MISHKNRNNTWRAKISLLFAMLWAMVFGITSCEKPGITNETFDASNVMAISFWENGDDNPVGLFVDTSKQLNNTGDLYFSSATDYLVLYAGNRHAHFTNLSSGDEIIASDITLAPKKAYSIFLTGTEATPETVFTEDDLTPPGDTKFKVRFANMSVGSTGINLAFQQDRLLPSSPPNPIINIVSGTAYKTVSPFVVVDSTSKSFTVYAIAGTDTLARLGADFKHNQTYTISLGGTTSGPNGIVLKQTHNLFDY